MPLSPSRHNAICPIPGTGTSIIVNPLAGSADMFSDEEAAAVRAGRHPNSDLLEARGYLVEPQEETRRYREAFAEFIDQRETDEVQLFFVPGYECNFGCDYCYQSKYDSPPAQDDHQVIEAFFQYVDQQFAGRRCYVTLFGGEPLLPGVRRRARLERFVRSLAERKLDLAVVTNGYHLTDYLDLLSECSVREIQVTLDGVGAVHDSRRPLRGGGATFDRITAGIDAALQRGFAINLRMVVDRDNLGHLPELARFARDRGWTRHPRFKTQLGRNYELHECAARRDRLYDRSTLYRDYVALAETHPELLDLHRPALSVSRALADQGELPPPLFDSCPGTKTEWAFDASGRIYACTATVGKSGEELGTFYPEVNLDTEAVEEWSDRDVLSIEACRNCSAQLLCGGGCAAVAKHRHGTLQAPDCRPVIELVGLGARLYLGDQIDDHVQHDSDH